MRNCIGKDKTHMGLDMYLFAEKYESEFTRSPLDMGKPLYPEALKEVEKSLKERHTIMAKTTRYKIGYWRKAWDLHYLFIENVIYDEGAYADVDEKALKNMIEEISQVVTANQRDNGTALTDEERDELNYTLETFKIALRLIEQGYDITYYASW